MNAPLFIKLIIHYTLIMRIKSSNNFLPLVILSIKIKVYYVWIIKWCKRKLPILFKKYIEVNVMSKILYLMRHGQTMFNLRGKYKVQVILHLLN